MTLDTLCTCGAPVSRHWLTYDALGKLIVRDSAIDGSNCYRFTPAVVVDKPVAAVLRGGQ